MMSAGTCVVLAVVLWLFNVIGEKKKADREKSEADQEELKSD